MQKSIMKMKEKKCFSRSVPEDKKKIPNQKNIINKSHVENEDNNSKIVRTNTFALTKQTSLISHTSHPLSKQDELHFENLTLHMIVSKVFQ